MALRLKLLILPLFFFVANSAFAATAAVDMKWKAPTKKQDGSTLTDLAGYRVYYGARSGEYDKSIDVGKRTTYRLKKLLHGTRYYFNVTAYDQSGNESVFGKERSAQTTPSPYPRSEDRDQDGIPDVDDDDLDNDGLTNEEEKKYGTDPYKADTDGDGYSDYDEIRAGTNPLDPGSIPEHSETGGCALWNSAVPGMWNVFEQVNPGDKSAHTNIALFDAAGAAVGSVSNTLDGYAQSDALVHEWVADLGPNQGRICAAKSGPGGAVDGRMVNYLPEINPHKGRMFQYAYAHSVSPGRRGRQTVSYNTFNPSMAWGTEGNLPANWLHITNLQNKDQNGVVVIYDNSGTALFQIDVQLSAGGQYHLPIHGLGRNLIGTIDWFPADTNANFLVNLSRYLHDNPQGYASYDGAVQLQGGAGTGETLYLPVDTVGRNSVLEVSNASGKSVNAYIQIVGGGSSAEMNVPIAAHGVEHVLLDPVIGADAVGFVSVSSDAPTALRAEAIHYGRRADGGIQYMYSIRGKEPTGKVLSGSYNTFLGQSSWVALTSTVPQQVTLKVMRADGTKVAEEKLKIDGVRSIDVSGFEGPDRVGTVQVIPEKPHSMVGWVMRVKPYEFVIPTEMR